MPASFLDVGGGASSEQVAHAFEILLSDKNVKAVLINIFGGILRVDTLATGVVEAARKTQIKLPIVLRLEGTNDDAGRERSCRGAGGLARKAGRPSHGPPHDGAAKDSMSILVNKSTRVIVQGLTG